MDIRQKEKRGPVESIPATPPTKKQKHETGSSSQYIPVSGFQSTYPPCIIGIIRSYLPMEDPEDHRVQASMDVLTCFGSEQQRAFDQIWTAPAHVLVLGVGGSGKSFLINALRRLLPGTAVCAFTGMAANSIGGRTIDSLLHSECQYIARLQSLIVDEVSLCSAQKLSHLLSKGIKKLLMFGDFAQLPPVVTEKDLLPTPETPGYAGQRLDALTEFRGHHPDTGALLAFEHEMLRDPAVRLIVLTTQFRQKQSEKRLLHALTCVRKGYHTDFALRRFFDDRHLAYQNLPEDQKTAIVHLYFKKSRADAHNARMFDLLEGKPEQTYQTTHEWSVQLDRYGSHHSHSPNTQIQASYADVRQEIEDFFAAVPEYVSLLGQTVNLAERPRVTFSFDEAKEAYYHVKMYHRRSMELSTDVTTVLLSKSPYAYVPASLSLLETFSQQCLKKRPSKYQTRVTIRVGQRVMCTQNNPRAGIHNGLMGIVLRLAPTSIWIQTDDEQTVEVRMCHTYEPMNLRTTAGHHMMIPMISTRYHLPVIGANAITIHKAQGQTLRRAVLFLGNCNINQPGLAYVGLSRCTNEDGLYLGEKPHASAGRGSYASICFEKLVQKHQVDHKHYSLCLQVHARCTTPNCRRFYVERWAKSGCGFCFNRE